MVKIINPTDSTVPPRILIAGMGNVLRRDDGFGVQVARRLEEAADLPLNVDVIEVGIGGIAAVTIAFALFWIGIAWLLGRGQGAAAAAAA